MEFTQVKRREGRERRGGRKEVGREDREEEYLIIDRMIVFDTPSVYLQNHPFEYRYKLVLAFTARDSPFTIS